MPVLFCRTLVLSMAYSLAGGRAHNEIAPRSCMLRSCRAKRRRGGNQPEPSRRTGLPKSIEELFGKRKHNEAKLAAVLAPLHGKRSLCRRGPKWGFISVRFFRCKASFQVSFSSSEDGVILCYRFFKASRLPLSPKKMRDERLLRCHKLLPSGAKRHFSKSCRYRNRKISFAIISVQFFCRQSCFKPHFWTCR